MVISIGFYSDFNGIYGGSMGRLYKLGFFLDRVRDGHSQSLFVISFSGCVLFHGKNCVRCHGDIQLGI